MKRQWMITIAALACVAPMAVPAQAQEANVVQPVVTATSGQAASTGTRTMVGAVEMRTTTDRPYSAEQVNESLQMLPDGNKIHRASVTKVYRDSAGRTRREMLNDDGTVRSISISDPVGKVSYTLDPKTKIAIKGAGGGGRAIAGGVSVQGAPIAAAGGGGGGTATATATGRGTAAVTTSGSTAGLVSIARVEGGSIAVGGRGGTREALDPQTIEGLSATGSRTTTIIPAGEIGNAQELKIISEQWFSEELQVLVMTKHNDPRSGETLYRLRSVLRAEPDPTLFMVPADYTLQERR